MKKPIIAILLGLILIIGIIPVDTTFAVQEEKDRISIIFTHDIHSRLKEEPFNQDGEVRMVGGLSRLKTGIEQLKKDYPQSLLVDAGDFSMGTPFQTIYETEAPELILMGQLGYDATTLGNHEFDYRLPALTAMLNAAVNKRNQAQEKAEPVYNPETYRYEEVKTPFPLPTLVGTNVDWEKTLESDKYGEDGALFQKAWDNYGGVDYTVVEKNGLRVAIFGLMGPEAIEDAPLSGMVWEDYIPWAQRMVKEIKQNEEADMIVCLSHGGVNDPENREGEDIELAEAVPEIDVIISGHSHTILEEPIVVGETTIVACGCYTEYLGHLVLEKKDDRYQVAEYDLYPMDEGVAKDKEMEKKVDAYIPLIDKEYFSLFNTKYNEVLATAPFSLPPITDLEKGKEESSLGNFIADSYRYGANEADNKTDPVDVALVPAGTIRSSLSEGPITAKDAFNMSPLGVGADGIPGYPLVGIYLTGKEIKNAIEVDVSVSPDMPTAQLYMSGISYAYNDHRIFFNKGIDVRLEKDGGEQVKLDNDQLYYVVAGLYSAQMLDAVKDKSKGLLAITPKDKEGNTIENIEDYILYKDGQELKEWQAIAVYLESFDGEIPQTYAKPDGRKVDKTGFNPYTLLKQPNRFGVIILIAILLPLILIPIIVVRIRRREYKKRGYRNRIFAGQRRKPARGKPQFKKRRRSPFRKKF